MVSCPNISFQEQEELIFTELTPELNKGKEWGNLVSSAGKEGGYTGCNAVGWLEGKKCRCRIVAAAGECGRQGRDHRGELWELELQ